MKTQPLYHPHNRNWLLHYGSDYKGLPVLYDEDRHGPLVVNFLEKTLKVLDRVKSRTSRTFALRFDLYLPPYNVRPRGTDEGSAILKDFWQNLSRELRRAHLTHKPNFDYIWAREVGAVAGRPHFHVLVLIDGNAIQTLGNPAPSPDATFSDNTMAHRITRSWLSALNLPATIDFGHLVHFQKDPYSGQFITHHLHRSDHHAWCQLFYIASYLCKAFSKQVGQGIRSFDTSRSYNRASSSTDLDPAL